LFKKKSNIEKVLLSGLKKSDHYCFRKLFDVYGQPLYRFSLNYLKSVEAAEDVVQEVFIKIWDRRKHIDEGKSFQSYIFTIVLNIIRKYFNKLSEENQLRHDIL
jgi:RNA polymerase sigma factor (sigma-70 family)